MSNIKNNPLIKLEIIGRLAHIRLNRLKGANSFNGEMRAGLRDIIAQVKDSPKIYCLVISSDHSSIFSAGADIKSLSTLAGQSHQAAIDDLADEYHLLWELRHFPKPTISLIKGGALGFGFGLLMCGSHHVINENCYFSMPEAALGFVPDAGCSQYFGDLSHPIGRFLAMTGYRLTSADMLYLGLAEHVIDEKHYPHILESLSDGQPVDALLDELHAPKGTSQIKAFQPLIERSFSQSEIKAIKDELNQAAGEEGAWAKDILNMLERGSPTALQMIIRQFDGTKRTIQQALKIEYQLAGKMLAGPDFLRGVENVLTKRDLGALWPDQQLFASKDEIEHWFSEPFSHQLDLQDYQDL